MAIVHRERSTRLGLLMVGAILFVLSTASPALAGFDVTDEHTGQTFNGSLYLATPYECALPCAFSFNAIRSCNPGSASVAWWVRDSADRPIATAAGAEWRYEFTALGDFSVQESESSPTCGSGGLFRVRVVDRTPPDTIITSGPPPVTSDSTPSFEFAANEAGTTFACRFDGEPFAPCTSPLTAPTLAVGGHTFEVQAVDAAGNADPTPAQRAFRVSVPDVTAPTLNLAAPRSMSLRGALRRGVSFKATTNEAARMVARLYLGPASARSLKVARHARRPVIVGARERHVSPGTTASNVRLSRKARIRLRDATSVRLRLVVRVIDAAGNERRRSLRITLA